MRLEKWGSGLKRIYNECRANGIEVQFKVVESGFVTTFIRPADEEKFSPKISEKNSPKTEDKIIALVKNNNSITTEMMAQELGVSKRAIIKQIAKLKNMGKLKRVGPLKGGHWEVIEK